MSLFSREEKIKIFTSLFKGRDDVFAQRWEKWNRSVSGYSPVAVPKKYGDKCFCDRSKKFKCIYCEERGYLKLIDSIIEDHLIGRRTIGIYPLLIDNSSYFVAGDFDGDSLEPYKDQWEFLSSVEKISPERLDILFNEFAQRKLIDAPMNNSDKLPIIIAKQIFIPKDRLTRDLSRFLTENLNFVNSEFLIKRKMGLSTFGVERYFNTIFHDDHHVMIPRGFLDELIQYLNKNHILFSIEDRRQKFEPVSFIPTFQLFGYQKTAVDAFDNKDNGILVAPPGSGKTIMGLA